MDVLGNFQVAVEVGVLLVGFALGIAWLRSQLVRQRHMELEELANTRGLRVEDLEKRVAEQNERIIHLEGQMSAMISLKTAEIVDGVTEILIPLINANHDSV